MLFSTARCKHFLTQHIFLSKQVIHIYCSKLNYLVCSHSQLVPLFPIWTGYGSLQVRNKKMVIIFSSHMQLFVLK